MTDWVQRFMDYVPAEQAISRLAGGHFVKGFKDWPIMIESANLFREANPDCDLTAKQLVTEYLRRRWHR